MAMILAVVLSAASFLLAFAAGPVRAAERPTLAADGMAPLTPQERDTILQGRIALRTLPPDGRKGRTYEAVGLIQGTLDEAVAVLTDFERYTEYMPNVSAARVCERAAPCAIVESTLRLPLGVKKQFRLRYTSERDETGFMLSWEMLPWPELKASRTIADTSGFWSVRPFEAGSLIVVYRVYTDPGHVPLGLTGVAQRVAKSKIPDGIVSLRERIRTVFLPAAK